MDKCPRCKGTGKFRFGGIDSICICPAQYSAVLSSSSDEAHESDDEVVSDNAIAKKKRKRREGAGAAY